MTLRVHRDHLKLLYNFYFRKYIHFQRNAFTFLSFLGVVKRKALFFIHYLAYINRFQKNPFIFFILFRCSIKKCIIFHILFISKRILLLFFSSFLGVVKRKALYFIHYFPNIIHFQKDLLFLFFLGVVNRKALFFIHYSFPNESFYFIYPS